MTVITLLPTVIMGVGNIDIELILIKYLQFNSNHPSQHKCSVATTYLDRAKNIPSPDADKLSEVQHVVDALKINGYTVQFIRSCQSATVSTNQSQTNRGFVTLPGFKEFQKKNRKNFKSV